MEANFCAHEKRGEIKEAQRLILIKKLILNEKKKQENDDWRKRRLIFIDWLFLIF